MAIPTTKLSLIALTFFVLAALAARPAAAQVHVNSLTIPATITNPNGGFNITYALGGSVFGEATVTVDFYLSTTSNGHNNTAAFLTTVRVGLNGSGAGPFGAPTDTRTMFISPGNLDPNGRALLQSLANACAPQHLFLIADIDGGIFSGPAPATTIGTTKLPDFAFAGGTISSTVIAPGGTTNISFDLSTTCPAPVASRVGIFLTDASFNPLSFIGAVSVAAGAGISSLPPTPITFAPTIPLGSYNILLVADLDNVVAESNENNNGGSFPLTVVAATAKAAAAKAPTSLWPNVRLRDDVGPELEDLELDPPASYTAKF